MGTKHTKGEWVVLRDGFGGLHIDVHNRAAVIAQVVPENPTEEDEANAKLIAAAPDLFHALGSLCAVRCEELKRDGENPDNDILIEIAKQAIKKATE